MKQTDRQKTNQSAGLPEKKPDNLSSYNLPTRKQPITIGKTITTARSVLPFDSNTTGWLFGFIYGLRMSMGLEEQMHHAQLMARSAAYRKLVELQTV